MESDLAIPGLTGFGGLMATSRVLPVPWYWYALPVSFTRGTCVTSGASGPAQVLDCMGPDCLG